MQSKTCAGLSWTKSDRSQS